MWRSVCTWRWKIALAYLLFFFVNPSRFPFQFYWIQTRTVGHVSLASLTTFPFPTSQVIFPLALWNWVHQNHARKRRQTLPDQQKQPAYLKLCKSSESIPPLLRYLKKTVLECKNWNKIQLQQLFTYIMLLLQLCYSTKYAIYETV